MKNQAPMKFAITQVTLGPLDWFYAVCSDGSLWRTDDPSRAETWQEVYHPAIERHQEAELRSKEQLERITAGLV